VRTPDEICPKRKESLPVQRRGILKKRENTRVGQKKKEGFRCKPSADLGVAYDRSGKERKRSYEAEGGKRKPAGEVLQERKANLPPRPWIEGSKRVQERK